MPLHVPEKLPGFRTAAWIERKAQNISDPIERLKYLRQATAGRAPSRFGWAPVRLGWEPIAALCLVAVLLSMRSDAHFRRQAEIPRRVSSTRAQAELPNVWRIEETKDFEVYSNGLRIENQLAVANKPRSYQLVSTSLGLGKGMEWGPRRSQPAGIVFHTTESDQAPFERTRQHDLHRIGQETLLFVRNKRAYHFVIDRFGRVHRIVVESDAANHAGNSVWADSQWLYLELNQSFLGVSFEASMQTDQAPINEAQIHAARVLTEMLRSKYNIAAENCITHAQVSVNPDNMQIGYHTDWAANFPFREVGLPDNYARPLPGLYLCGFVYDRSYVASTGPRILAAIELSEERLAEAAARRHTNAASYREYLQQEYRKNIRALKKETPQGDA